MDVRGFDSVTLRRAIGTIALMLALAAPAVAAAQFASAGSIGTERQYHTVTPLAGDRVLVVGGLDRYFRDIGAAELYDPVCGISTPTTGTARGRARHTATLLDDGSVLVAGGYTAYSLPHSLSHAETFDPPTGTFVSTLPLVLPRYQHTATRLRDGRVLLVGGVVPAKNAYGIANTATAEIYDPNTRSFTSTLGSLSVARQWHTATLLDGGEVLIAGGVTGDPGNLVAVDTAEIYDPRTDTFRVVVARMKSPRSGHSATLLPTTRKVLLVGGSALNGTNVGTVASTEIFDPNEETFTLSTPLAEKRTQHAAEVTREGNVLIAGGIAGNVDVALAEVYDVASGAMLPAGNLIAPRYAFGMVKGANGQPYLIGGKKYGGFVTTVETYTGVPVCQ